MANLVIVMLRRPEQIRSGLEAGRKLCEQGDSARIVFLCPGCAARLACRSAAPRPGGHDPECFTDGRKDCAPAGFRSVEADRIARIFRRADLVVPL